MASFAKTILVALLIVTIFITFTNLIFFFPWYLTLVYETFSLSQAAAYDNYVRQSYYDHTLDELKSKPIFKEKAHKIKITAVTGDDDPYIYFRSPDKPYRQRGMPITVRISAVYPIRITIAGNQLEKEIPVEYSMRVMGLRYYKDLDYYGDQEGLTTE